MRVTAAVVLAVAAGLAGCAGGTGDTGDTAATSAEPTGITAAPTGDSASPSVVDPGDSATGVVSTVGWAGGPDGSVAVTGSTVVSGGPSTGEVDESGVPPRPLGCIDGPGDLLVELVVTPEAVELAASPAPACLRLAARQRIRVTSTAPFGTTVSIGATTTWLPPGGEVVGSVLGDRHPVGALLDVRIDVLAVTVTVQIVP